MSAMIAIWRKSAKGGLVGVAKERGAVVGCLSTAPDYGLANCQMVGFVRFGSTPQCRIGCQQRAPTESPEYCIAPVYVPPRDLSANAFLFSFLWFRTMRGDLWLQSRLLESGMKPRPSGLAGEIVCAKIFFSLVQNQFSTQQRC